MRRIMKLNSLLLLAVLLTASCSKKEVQPEFRSVENVSIERKAGVIYLKADLIMYNPNRVGLELKNADLDIFINAKNVGNVSQIDASAIKARSNFTLPLDLEFPPKKVFDTFLQTGFGMIRTKTIDLGIEGTFRVQAAKITWPEVPVSYKKEVDISRK